MAFEQANASGGPRISAADNGVSAGGPQRGTWWSRSARLRWCDPSRVSDCRPREQRNL